MSGNQDPVIILVEPQLGENIGMCARAMLNCGLSKLRLVNPRDGWPQDAARATAADADIVIDRAEVFATLDGAIADCHRVFATTARERSQTIPVLNAEAAAAEIKLATKGEGTVAVLFGPEASGLDGESIARADTLLRFPTNPEFSSLNLAQAVLLLGWEWRRSAIDEPTTLSEETATREELEGFLARLFETLDEKEFFLTEEMKPHSIQLLRILFTKANATPQEVKLLHGMLSALKRDSGS
ncbi:MAG: RNA methyltransferase [Verrucomicrobiales bacterium]|nr:RNA methyltransferase [Verrucomicrobiales bacterium]